MTVSILDFSELCVSNEFLNFYRETLEFAISIKTQEKLGDLENCALCLVVCLVPGNTPHNKVNLLY